MEPYVLPWYPPVKYHIEIPIEARMHFVLTLHSNYVLSSSGCARQLDGCLDRF
jgi:hypothetical protein